ncbi:MAG: Mut7-C RNAse domain-containing protein [Thermodesulfobacteriota bacterium]
MPVKVILHGDLSLFLPRQQRNEGSLEIDLTRRTSIKDFLEALGVPHPEIFRLTANNQPTTFAYIVAGEDRLEVYPFPTPVDLTEENLLRAPLKQISFAVDANVGKLARLLRMAGFDTFFDQWMDDEPLAEKAQLEERILLTRDRALLKRKTVIHGRLIRSIMPADQLREIILLYNLQGSIKPFSHCLCCNEVLQPVAKKDIVARLEPLTKKYFADFHICPACNRIYWPGSHRDNMHDSLQGI